MGDDAPCCTFCGDENTVVHNEPFGLTVVNACQECALRLRERLTPSTPRPPTEGEGA